MKRITFNGSGNPQPAGVQKVDRDEWIRFYSDIENKEDRAELLRLLAEYVSDFKNRVTPETWRQWIWGSFTTTKPNPKDIDLVNFLDYGSLNEILSESGPYFSSSEESIDSRKRYKIDSYHVALYPENDVRNKLTKQSIAYWEKWFGHDRKNLPKAVFEVAV